MFGWTYIIPRKYLWVFFVAINYTIQDLNYNPKYLPTEFISKYSNFILKDDDLIIAMTDLANDPKILGLPTIVKTKGKNVFLNQRVGKLEILDENVYTPYLRRALSDPKVRKYYSKFAGGGLQINIGKKEILDVEILLPPMSIQIKIANALDKAQELIDNRKTQIDKYDELLQSVFIDMFGDPVSNLKGWRVKKLGDILNNIDSGWSPKCNSKKAIDDSWGVLKLSAVTGGEYNQEENKELPSELTPKLEKEVKKGDLLMTRKNTPELVGDCAYVFETKPNLMMPDLVFRFDTKVGVNKKYLWKLFIEKKFKKKIKGLAGGSAKSMSNISKAKLKELEITLPPLELQNQFASIVEKVEEEKKNLEGSLEELENNFNSIMQKAFRGELF